MSLQACQVSLQVSQVSLQAAQVSSTLTELADGRESGIGLHNDSMFVMSILTVILLATYLLFHCVYTHCGTFTERRHENQG